MSPIIPLKSALKKKLAPMEAGLSLIGHQLRQLNLVEFHFTKETTDEEIELTSATILNTRRNTPTYHRRSGSRIEEINEIEFSYDVATGPTGRVSTRGSTDASWLIHAVKNSSNDSITITGGLVVNENADGNRPKVSFSDTISVQIFKKGQKCGAQSSKY